MNTDIDVKNLSAKQIREIMELDKIREKSSAMLMRIRKKLCFDFQNMQSKNGALLYTIWKDEYNHEYLRISNGNITFVCDFLHENYALTLSEENLFSMYKAAYYDKFCDSAKMLRHFEAFVDNLVNWKYEDKAKIYAIEHFTIPVLKDESNPYHPVFQAIEDMPFDQLIEAVWIYEDAFADILLCSRRDFDHLLFTYRKNQTKANKKCVLEQIDLKRMALHISRFSKDIVQANNHKIRTKHGEGVHSTWISNSLVIYTVSRRIDPEWNEYDRTVAMTHLDNYGVFFLDEFGQPVDNEYDLEKFDMDLKSNSR